jgi:hypothetical protein
LSIVRMNAILPTSSTCSPPPQPSVIKVAALVLLCLLSLVVDHPLDQVADLYPGGRLFAALLRAKRPEPVEDQRELCNEEKTRETRIGLRSPGSDLAHKERLPP